MTFELSAHIHTAPGTVETMPIRDAFGLLETINKRRAEQLRFEAAIHGAKLR